jgi:hypothetical protein
MGWAAPACFSPHFGQNAKSGRQEKPQPAQRAGWRVPHFGQNANSSRSAKPQATQCIDTGILIKLSLLTLQIF